MSKSLSVNSLRYKLLGLFAEKPTDMRVSAYLKINGSLVFLSELCLLVTGNLHSYWFPRHLATIFLRNTIILLSLYALTKNRPLIQYRDEISASETQPSIPTNKRKRAANLAFYFTDTSFIAKFLISIFATELVMSYLMHQIDPSFDTQPAAQTFSLHHIVSDYLKFLPISCLFELVFDFFHYWAHRICHVYPFLYRNVHKLHHQHVYPSVFTTYHHTYYELALTNIIPACTAILMLSSLKIIHWNLRLLNLLLTYKAFIEVAGHIGAQVKAKSFPQFPVLHYLGVCMETNDHDYHHYAQRWNFSKRLVLWDKVFKTYKKPVYKPSAPSLTPCPSS